MTDELLYSVGTGIIVIILLIALIAVLFFSADGQIPTMRREVWMLESEAVRTSG